MLLFFIILSLKNIKATHFDDGTDLGNFTLFSMNFELNWPKYDDRLITHFQVGMILTALCFGSGKSGNQNGSRILSTQPSLRHRWRRRRRRRAVLIYETTPPLTEMATLWHGTREIN